MSIFEYTEEDFSVFKDKISKEIKIDKYKPDFLEGSTIFEKLVYSAVGLFITIISKYHNIDYSGFLLVLSKSSKNTYSLINSFSVNNKEDFLINLFTILYNYYIQGKDENLLIGFDSDLSEGLLFNIDCIAKCKRLNLTKLSKQKASDYWKELYTDIRTNLYIDMEFYRSLTSCFDNLYHSCNMLQNDMFGELLDRNSNKILKFPKIASIDEYINSCYRLLVSCIKGNSVFTQSYETQKLMGRLLNFGVNENFDEIKDFWMFSPFALNSLKTLYNRIIVFSEEIEEYYKKGSKVFSDMLINSFISSCLKEFERWEYIDRENYITTFEKDSLSLKKLRYDNISSVNKINVVSLYSKIKSYLNTHSDKSKVKVCIVGDTSFINGKLLDVEELKNLIDDDFSNKEIFYTVMMNGSKISLKEENKVDNISLINVNYDWLFGRQRMYYLLDEYDLIFFLDCPNLYYKDFYPHFDRTWDSVYNMYLGISYSSNYTNVGVGLNIGKNSILNNIGCDLSLLSSVLFSESGSFKPMLKKYMLDYIDSFIKQNSFVRQVSFENKNYDKVVYCYLSTVESPNSYFYKDKRNTSIEYFGNEKYYVVKLSNADVKVPKISKVIKVAKKKEIGINDIITEPIVLPLYEILNAISLNGNKQLFTSELLNKIILELYWNKSMSNFVIRYGIKSDVNKKIKNTRVGRHLCTLIKEIFEVVLKVNGCKSTMLDKIIREGISRVLLGYSYNPIQFLLCYRIIYGDLQVSSLICKEIEDDYYIDVLMSETSLTQVTEGNMYLDSMMNLTYGTDSISRSAVKVRIVDNEGNPDVVLGNIYKACELCDYTDSGVYSTYIRTKNGDKF